ncbi:MAG TPA: hypothetical protein VGQ22_21495 [Steroidobacteraceae bacterium]|jgi:hypothetical protein|nr:hypothetical protein [Steroidobacteraceae bacterium]
MFRARAWSGLLLVSALVFLMGARQVPLTDPDPIAVPAGLKIDQVTKAIKAALVGRTWAVTQEDAGHIVSTLHLREHMAKIDIVYDAQTITIKYLDSGELMYADKKGQRVIHRNYLTWIQNLVNDMSRNLTLVQS